MKNPDVGDLVVNNKMFTKNGVVWTKGSLFKVASVYDDGCIIEPHLLVENPDNVDVEVVVCISHYKTFGVVEVL